MTMPSPYIPTDEEGGKNRRHSTMKYMHETAKPITAGRPNLSSSHKTLDGYSSLVGVWPSLVFGPELVWAKCIWVYCCIMSKASEKRHFLRH